MKKVKLSHFKNNQELRILLPGIYEIVNLSFPNNPESDAFNYSLRISWQNKNNKWFTAVEKETIFHFFSWTKQDKYFFVA